MKYYRKLLKISCSEHFIYLFIYLLFSHNKDYTRTEQVSQLGRNSSVKKQKLGSILAIWKEVRAWERSSWRER